MSASAEFVVICAECEGMPKEDSEWFVLRSDKKTWTLSTLMGYEFIGRRFVPIEDEAGRARDVMGRFLFVGSDKGKEIIIRYGDGETRYAMVPLEKFEAMKRAIGKDETTNLYTML